MSTTLNPNWFGMLCAANRDTVVERMQQVLDGQFFTMVICNSYDDASSKFSSVEVYPSQRLTIPIVDNSGGSRSHIGWGTPRLSMGVGTQAQTMAEARESAHDFVQFNFAWNRIEIRHYAPAGYSLLWIFAVEDHTDYDEAAS